MTDNTKKNEHFEQRDRFRKEEGACCKEWNDRAVESDKMAIDLAHQVFKTSIMLNGGAIIALPALTKAFAINSSTTSTTLYIATMLFCSGLTSSWLSSVFGFFSLANRGNACGSIGAALSSELAILHFEPKDTLKSDWEERAKENREKSDKYEKWFLRYRSLAILFSLISFACFLSGSYYGSKTIIDEGSNQQAIISQTDVTKDTATTHPVKQSTKALETPRP